MVAVLAVEAVEEAGARATGLEGPGSVSSVNSRAIINTVALRMLPFK